MSKELSDKDKQDIAKLTAGASVAGGALAGGAYVKSAKDRQRTKAADDMMKEYGRRLDQEIRAKAGEGLPDKEAFRRSGKVPLNKSGKPYKSGQEFEKAFGRWRSKFKNKKGEIKPYSQIPEYKQRYSKYGEKVAKLTKTKFVKEYRSKTPEDGGIIKERGRSKGRSFKAKGLVSLLAATLFPRASLRKYNLIGKLGAQREKYRPADQGGKKYIGGLVDRGASQKSDRYYVREKGHPLYGKKFKQ